MKAKLLLVGLFTAAVSFAADTVPLTFNAVLTTGRDQRFGVATQGGARSTWLRVGEEFEGYKLNAFEEDEQTLVFEKEGETVHVPLATGGVQTLNTKATLVDAAQVMERMNFEQMMSRMMDQQKATLASLSRQMLGPLEQQVSAGDFAALQSRIMDSLWAELQPEQMKAEMTKIYADLFTRDQLRSMGDFYATPAGQALIDKQPEMQQRMLDVMMPRMMRAMPKIQEMTQQFATEQTERINPPVAPPAVTPKQ